MKAHYEKVICVCCFLALFCNIGLASTSFSVYQPYIVAIPGVGDAGGSMVQSTRILVSMVAMIFVDRYYRLLDVRLGTTLATVLVALAFLVYSFADSLPLLLLGAFIAGLAYGLGGMISTTMLVNRWFRSGIGTAIGFSSVGSGVAFMVIPFMATRLAESVSLAAAFRAESLIAIVLAAIIFTFMRNRPSDLGLEPYGIDPRQKKGKRKPPATEPVSVSAVARRALIVTMVLVGAVSMSAMQYYSVLLVSQGFDVHFAAMLLSVSGICLTFSKFAMGELFDRAGGPRATVFTFSLLLAGLVLCCLTSAAGEAGAIAAALLVGAGLCIGSVGISVWSLQLSDAEHRTKSIKNCQVAYAFGGFAMTALPGPLKELTGTYVTAYVLLVVLAACAATMILILYRKNYQSICS